MILCVDFDGVVHDRANPLPGKKMGGLLDGAEDVLDDLYRAGHKIIIHTTMANSPSGRRAVADWLEFYGVDYHEIQPKPQADIYLDDRGIQHVNWPKTIKELNKRGLDLDEMA